MITKEDYSGCEGKLLDFDVILTYRVCPGCQNLHGWSRHAKYFKYHGDSQILIHRFRCKACKRTHALIPSFSLPQTSLDTAETQNYLQQRHLGKTHRAAAEASSFAGRSHDFLRSLEKRFAGAVVRAKAVLSSWGNEHTHGYAWLESASSGQDQKLEFLNDRVIALCGASFFGGNLRDSFEYRSAGSSSSHKNTAYGFSKTALDSG